MAKTLKIEIILSAFLGIQHLEFKNFNRCDSKLQQPTVTGGATTSCNSGCNNQLQQRRNFLRCEQISSFCTFMENILETL